MSKHEKLYKTTSVLVWTLANTLWWLVSLLQNWGLVGLANGWELIGAMMFTFASTAFLAIAWLGMWLVKLGRHDGKIDKSKKDNM